MSSIAKVLCKRTVVVNVVNPLLRTHRLYSRKRNQTGSFGPFKIVKTDQSNEDSSSLNHGNNNNWELFATHGYPFYMPGNVGPAWQNTETSETFVQLNSAIASNHCHHYHAIKSLHDSNNSSNQNQINSTLNGTSTRKYTTSNKNNNKAVYNDATTNIKNSASNVQSGAGRSVLSCVVNECPMVLRQGIWDLFGNGVISQRAIDLKSSVLTVITLIQHPASSTNYSGAKDDHCSEHQQHVSTEVIVEKLAKNFVLTAQDICMTLTVMGYWADFINPFSGKPYNLVTYDQSASASASVHFNKQMNATKELDERLQGLDFQIVQQHNCTIIKNDKYLENMTGQPSPASSSRSTSSSTAPDETFIGNLFTNAPHNIGYLLDIKSCLS